MMTESEIVALVTDCINGKEIQWRREGYSDKDWDHRCLPGFNFIDFEFRVKPKKPYIARIITWDSDRLMDDDAPVGAYVELTDEVKALLGDMVDD